MPAYHLLTLSGELPPTKTLPRPGQRQYWVHAPGVLGVDADGEAVETCEFDVEILQEKGKLKTDHEAYHVSELDELTVLNLPRDARGRSAHFGYLFVCYTSEPTPERPGVYKVACGLDGRAYWCSCLGSVGHHQKFGCRHRHLITALVERSASGVEK